MEAALRWSPHSTDDRQRFLIADVADSSLILHDVQSVGKSTILHRPVAQCGKLPAFGAFDWSKTNESVIALGLLSGSASLVKLHDDGKASEIVATFRIKQQRKCNSIAFSARDWLAVAVDKTRSDVCLFVYDTVRGAGDAEPIRRLCAAELVSSVRFFPSQPQEVLASTQRSFIRLYDLRESSTNTSSVPQVSTRNVNNIAIDPTDENYFASAGSTDDPLVTIWDKRWMSQAPVGSSHSAALFDFRPAVNNSSKATVWSLRYSGQRRGRLAICASTGEMRIIDMADGTLMTGHEAEAMPPLNPYGGAPWHRNPYICATRILEQPWYDQERGRERSTRIVAYDWTNVDDIDQPILVLRPNRAVDILRVSSARPSAEITARQGLGLAFTDATITGAKVESLLCDAVVRPAPLAQASEQPFVSRDEDPSGSGDDLNGNMNNDSLLHDRSSPIVRRLLSLGAVQQERCRRGYLFDCHKNSELVAGNCQLERLWETIGRFREQASSSGMCHGSLDLSYVGISGLWSEEIGPEEPRKLSASACSVEDAVVGLNAVKEIPAFEGERTDFPENRQLCLAVCGWKFTIDTLEAECNELIERGLHYQAIVQAVLHGYKHVALNLLRTLIRSKTISNIGLGALLAADALNEDQREMCLWMAADTADPALKALLTYLVTGNWRDVMKTTYLHLGYRVALGLKYLNDTELSGFIQSETARAVKNGDLEGILLTGLGEQAMDLFQTYMSRTNDLQTAVLATAFVNPRYVNDVRWELWEETYLNQMQSWRAFVPRAKFVVQHARMSVDRTGSSLLSPAPAQVAMKCLHCNGSLLKISRTRRRTSSLSRSRTQNGLDALPPPMADKVSMLAAHAGTVCPHCGRHMPRCAICSHWLGTPDVQGKKKKSMRGPEEGNSARDVTDVLSRLITFCALCGHGAHAHHAKMWFERHRVCPVPDCECLCAVR